MILFELAMLIDFELFGTEEELELPCILVSFLVSKTIDYFLFVFTDYVIKLFEFFELLDVNVVFVLFCILPSFLLSKRGVGLILVGITLLFVLLVLFIIFVTFIIFKLLEDVDELAIFCIVLFNN
jgi:hypothetical protein